MYSLYYQAHLIPHTTWLVTSLLRNEEGWSFDRTIEGHSSLLEFFVSPNYEEEFCSFMNYCIEKGYVYSLEKMNNRLQA